MGHLQHSDQVGGGGGGGGGGVESDRVITDLPSLYDLAIKSLFFGFVLASFHNGIISGIILK